MIEIANNTSSWNDHSFTLLEIVPKLSSKTNGLKIVILNLLTDFHKFLSMSVMRNWWYVSKSVTFLVLVAWENGRFTSPIDIHLLDNVSSTSTNNLMLTRFGQKRHLTKLVFLSVHQQTVKPTREQFVVRREKEVQNATIVTGTKISRWNISLCHAQSLKKSDRSFSLSWEANLRLSASGAFRCGRDSQPAAQPASRKLSLERKVLVPWRTKL